MIQICWLEDCKSQRPVTDFSEECLVLLMTCLLSGLALVNPRIVKARLFLTCYKLSFFLLWCLGRALMSVETHPLKSVMLYFSRFMADIALLESNRGLTSKWCRPRDLLIASF